MSSEFGFLVIKFSEVEQTLISLGCRQLRNSTLLIRLPGTVSNGPNARQPEMSLKGSFKLLESIRCLLRNVKRFQKINFFFSGKIIRVCAYYNIARLSPLWNSTLPIRRPGTVSNGLNARQSEIWIKMPLKGFFKPLKSIRCLPRNVKRC